jgi:signal transduction histidine kinase
MGSAIINIFTKNKYLYIVLVLLFTLLGGWIISGKMDGLFNIDRSTTQINNAPDHSLKVTYLEDKEGTYTIKSLQKSPLKGQFIPVRDGNIVQGQSRSVWWVRLESQPQDYILMIQNPTVEHLQAYLNDDNGTSHTILTTGWGFPNGAGDLGFIYPALEVPSDQTVYLRLYSSYIQSYQVRMLSYPEYQSIVARTLLLIGLFTGIMIAVTVLQIYLLCKCKEAINFFFILHILMMMLYQFAVLGVYRLLDNPLGDYLVSIVDLWGGLAMTTIALFAYSILKNTNQRRPSYWVLIYALSGMTLLILNALWGTTRLGNNISIFFAFTVGITLLFLTISATRQNYIELKYFSAGYTVLVIGMLIFSARLAGFIPNNFMTMSALLITHVCEILLFSAGIAEVYNHFRQKATRNEMDLLRAQIKPHFLYNTLNVIAAVALESKLKARSLLLDFAQYLRYNIEPIGQDMIPLEEELAVVEAYVRIQQARFPGTIELIFELDEAIVRNIRIPPFVIQPLVENAIGHGLSILKPGHVKIGITPAKNGVEIYVEDNGCGLSPEKVKLINSDNFGESAERNGGIALPNIKRRLKHFCHTSLYVISIPDVYTKFSFIVPEVNGENSNN